LAASPRVSIGMPVYNGERFIRQGMESLLAQSFGDFELIVCDNASTDGTREIAEEIAARDARVRYHRNPTNIGLAANFALGLEFASAPYFMWGCHDDLWDPTYIERAVSVLDTVPGAVLAGCDAVSVDQYGVPHRTFYNTRVYAPGSPVARALRFIGEPPDAGHSTLIFSVIRTPILKRVNQIKGQVQHRNMGSGATDKFTLLRLIFEGDFEVTPDNLYFRRDVVPEGPLQADPLRVRAGRVFQAFRDSRGYYEELRRIVRGAPVSEADRARLLRAVTRAEAQHYPSYLVSLASRRSLWRGLRATSA
jgi:glycosyltransferase involved in cell wall biosynthesis